ncbi:MAG: UDP-3-O-[3-hydroxymyristoyl] N-acetylglucosamine deacetylase [Candidatus Dadabacteria bacterium]|nr:MAG: UDP-3-O-[3-hydroxymyristoyl] N-acetylglucosamine deacetylase [Candidatus Dadabacteria bacterium]
MSAIGCNLDQKASPPVILIVDDEEGICKAFEGIFSDEGYITVSAGNAEDAFDLIESMSPSLVFLDIWLPGKDGIETLVEIKDKYPNLPVVMISGHATIASAMKATKLGAADFIEKPLDLNLVLDAAKRCIENGGKGRWQQKQPRKIAKEKAGMGKGIPKIGTNPLTKAAFGKRSWRGRRIPQRTLKNSALLYGQGLHSGAKSGLIFEPLPPNSGIHFAELSSMSVVPAYVDFVESTGYATTLKCGDAQASTVEHLMSALHAYGICNLLVKCNGEVPVMDGSAIKFCELIEDVGIEEQDGEWYEIDVRKPVRVDNGKEFIAIEPADSFIIDYTLKYPFPLGEQRYVFELSGGVEGYKTEIAKARTFGFVRDVEHLQKQGLALGGRFDNFVLFGENGPINCDLRYTDEPVRHKILDVIGDLYLLGRPIKGKVSASMSGHSDNISLLCALKEAMLDEAEV